jgi:flagellar hook-associated protein 2
MGRIQSTTGLATGIDIQGTVQKLMQIEAAPRDALVARQKDVQAQQAAVTDLTALAIGVQLAVQRLKKPDLFQSTNVTSSNPDILTATTTTGATPGQYQFVPARMALANHALSSGVTSSDSALGGGTFTFRFGGQADTAIALNDLNADAGVSRGQIKITDRSGGVATVDLRYAQTIDDVIAAIDNAGIGVTARADGDHLVLDDSSGGSGNLRVQEIGTGTTAADLGLANINVAANEASGTDLTRLFSGLRLDQIRDGNGLSLRPAVAELSVTLHDGSTRQIDLDPIGDSSPKTLGDVISRINAADPGKLQAQISADGQRIELKDLTAGSGTFAVTSPLGGSVAEELGLTDPAVGDTITGARLVSGLKTTLLNSLAGGSGLGTLGTISLTDRSGATANVNLAGAETLDDVIDAINGSGLRITASYNSARNGIALTDTTGATTSNLIVADGDATTTATKLGLAANAAASSINSGNLRRQTVGRGTLLTSYNGGQGVASGTFKITNSRGATGLVNLTALKPNSIGDVIDAINGLALGVKAQINDAGDGIALIDTAGGNGTLTVSDQGTGQAAADLHLAGSGVATTVNNQPTQLLDGSTTFKIQLAAGETLDDLVSKINALAGGVAASTLNDGAGSLPAHLSLLSNVTGRAGELLIDGSGLGLSFRDLTTAQDATLQVGGSASGGALISSQTNTFKGIVPGLDVALSGQSTDPVTVTVAQSSDDAANALQLLVDQYNKLRDKLDTYTSYNATDNTTGTLFGATEALNLDSQLSQTISGSYVNSGSIRSLAELGVSIDDQGKLSFDKSQFEARYKTDPQAVTEFFTDDKNGFAVSADKVLESLVGKDNSLFVTRLDSLQRRSDAYANDINDWNDRLAKIQDRLLNEFYTMESIVSSIKNNLTAVSQIQYIPPIASTSSSRSSN